MSVFADRPPECGAKMDRSQDRFLKAPLIVAAAGPLGIMCLLAIPLGIGFLAAIPLLIIWLWVVLAFACGRAREWKGMISGLAPTFVLAVALSNFSGFLQLSARGSEYLHFAVLSPYYFASVASLPHDGARLARFDWGGMAFASQAVVYDETDELQLPAGAQSQAWLAKTKGSEFGCEGWGYRHLAGHFYIAYFPC